MAVKYYPGEPVDYNLRRLYNNGVIFEEDVNGKPLISGQAALAVANSVGGWDAQKRFAALGANPIGFNSYELFYRYVRNDQYTITNVTNMITYFTQSGVNIVRIAYPVFNESEYSSFVFPNGIPNREFEDTDFYPTFLSKSDQVFNALANAKIKALVCLFFGYAGLLSMFGETVLTGFRTDSQSYLFMQRFTRWFGKKYGQHAALGAYSFFNEVSYDVTGATWPTPANLGAVNSGLIAEMRKYAPQAVATSDYVPLPFASLLTRPTFTSELENIKTIAQGVDALGVHVYAYSPSGLDGVGHSFVGYGGSGNAALDPSPSNKLGFEGLPAFLTAMRSIAQSMGEGVGLWLNEIGVPTSIETSTESLRRRRLLSICQQYADVSLVWNAADVATPQANQVNWQIRPGTSLGDIYKTLAKDLNSGRTTKSVAGVGAGTTPLRVRRQPKYGMTSTRTAGATVSVTSVAAMTSTSQTFLAWIRRESVFNNAEALLDARGSGNTSGVILLGGPNAATDSEYVEFRAAAGAAGNSSGRLPKVADKEWYHLAVVYRVVNGQPAVEVWQNGELFLAFPVTGNYVGIPTGTVIRALGGATNGAPITMQDVTLINYASQEDIWAHMDGAVLPQSQMHLRADNVGVVDLSRNNLPVTVGAGVTFGPV